MLVHFPGSIIISLCPTLTDVQVIALSRNREETQTWFLHLNLIAFNRNISDDMAHLINMWCVWSSIENNSEVFSFFYVIQNVIFHLISFFTFSMNLLYVWCFNIMFVLNNRYTYVCIWFISNRVSLITSKRCWSLQTILPRTAIRRPRHVFVKTVKWPAQNNFWTVRTHMYLSSGCKRCVVRDGRLDYFLRPSLRLQDIWVSWLSITKIIFLSGVSRVTVTKCRIYFKNIRPFIHPKLCPKA